MKTSELTWAERTRREGRAGIAAVTPGDEKGVEGWLKEADLALYQAKEGGRNRVVVSQG